jgi:hypothetical protein
MMPREVKNYKQPISADMVAFLEELGKVDPEAVGPIQNGCSLEAVISIAASCEIRSISVMGATYRKTVKVGASYQVFLNTTKVGEGQFFPGAMRDNTWWKIPLRLKIGSGNPLTLRIINHDPDVGLGFYSCRNQFLGQARVGAKHVRPIAMTIEARG